MSEQNITEKMRSALMTGDTQAAEAAATELLGEGIPAMNAISHMGETMREIGLKFESHECFLPDLILAGDAFKAAFEKLAPHLQSAQSTQKGRVVIGSVEGDLHDLGKNIVAMMLETAGFYVHDLGVDVTPETFAEKASTLNVDIVAASAYMTTTTPQLKRVADALRQKDSGGRVKFLIGGAAVTSKHVEWAGADAYGESAVEAVKAAEMLMAER
ncbi:MAG: B12-binding domain-containing protein [Candidatus Bathyarchaeia archaeon]